ncbi:MAG TPA: VOC family protein [Streptosporangiaceae bacterium]
MSEDNGAPLSRAAASAAVTGLGWRYVLGVAQTSVQAGGWRQAAEAAAAIAARAGIAAEDRLLADIRGGKLMLTVRNPAGGLLTTAETELAGLVSAIMAGLGLRPAPGTGEPDGRSVQAVEIAIDALDIPAILPFWRAALGYADEPGSQGKPRAIVDQAGQGPAVWFQQMTEPRPQRNRIHLDISVPHDEARQRIDAALAAGGVLVSDAAAPAFWVLADAEGNEACITTWQGRDPS